MYWCIVRRIISIRDRRYPKHDIFTVARTHLYKCQANFTPIVIHAIQNTIYSPAAHTFINVKQCTAFHSLSIVIVIPVQVLQSIKSSCFYEYSPFPLFTALLFISFLPPPLIHFIIINYQAEHGMFFRILFIGFVGHGVFSVFI